MASALAQQFAANRTAANLIQLANAEPLTAASYLSRAANSAGLDGPWKAKLEGILSGAFDDGARETALRAFFTENQTALQGFDIGQLQAARVDTLGFTTHSPEPTTLKGIVGKTADGTAPTLTVNGQTYRLDIPNWPDKPYSGNQSAYFEVNVMQSFEGRTATIRAYPTAQPGSLAIEEFSPSSSEKFVSGRLWTRGGKLFLATRPDKLVEVRDPDTAALLRRLARSHEPGEQWGGTGVIIPNVVAKQDAQGWYLDGKVEDYWMLGRSQSPGTVLMGHSTGTFNVQGGTTPWPEDTNVRLLVFGHVNADGTITQKGFVQTPNVKIEAGIDPKRDAAALVALTPVALEVPAGVVDKFEP